MSSFIDLDSVWRDRDIYPNPCDYELSAEDINSWFVSAREVRAFPQNSVTRPLEFVTSVRLLALTLPYNATLITYPRVYVDVHCKLYEDINLIATIGGVLPTARFVCVTEKIQYDGSNNPIWIHYKCITEQVFRFSRKSPLIIQITSRDGTVLPFFNDTNTLTAIDPSQQSLITLSAEPYIRDEKYSNHNIETMTQ